MPPHEAGPPRLEEGQVDVWLTRPDDIGDALLRGYEQMLSEKEQFRLRRFVNRDAQLQYLVSRALVRTTLSRYWDLSAESWQFASNRYGRPYIAEPADFRDVRFNLSHTNGLVACAVTKACDVGIDVEYIRRDLKFTDLAFRFFSPPEVSRLLQSAPEMRRDLFFSFWTLKEAYIKARGKGLSLALDGFWFDLDGASPHANFTERCPDDSRRWQFRQDAPTLDHRLALAVADVKKPDIRRRWVVPLSGG